MKVDGNLWERKMNKKISSRRNDSFFSEKLKEKRIKKIKEFARNFNSNEDFVRKVKVFGENSNFLKDFGKSLKNFSI
jgi:ribosomal protein S6